MAKDGTNRGGPRPGQGRPSRALKENVNEGKAAMVMELPTPANLEGRDMPPIKQFLKDEQKNGKDLYAESVFKETWNWLVERGCEKLVSVQLLEQYSMAVSRWIQCEQAISEYGLLAKHPTTGAPIASPYVSMSRDYMKQVNSIWYSIFQIVKENSLTAYDGPTPQDDVMEMLLRSRKA